MKRDSFLEYALLFAVAVVVVVLVQAVVVKPYRIPSPSMVGTLEPGDRILASRLAYHFGDPQRGDVIVFRYPLDRSLAYIKRVVGAPGDTLSLVDGYVYRNGVLLNEPYVHVVDGLPEPTSVLHEPGVSGVAEPWSLNAPYTVPDDQYFVMGDHRLQSEDSRAWGTVARGDIIGRAFVIFWPLGRAETL